MVRWENKKIEEIKKKDRFGVFMDMGTGKTSLLLALIDYKFFYEDVKKVLIIAPKNVTISTWQDEIKKFIDFHYLENIVTSIAGTEKKRIELLKETKKDDFCIHIISSALVSWLDEKKIRKGRRNVFLPNTARPDYDLIIVDECSQFKDVTSARYKALEKISKGKKIFLLSGTPFMNIKREEKYERIRYKKGDEMYYVLKLLEIYPKSIYSFRNTFCFANPWEPHTWYMDEETYDFFLEQIKQKSVWEKFQTKDFDVREHVVFCPMDSDRLNVLKRDYLVKTNGLMDITAKNKAIMINKSLQLSNGFVYDHLDEQKTFRFNTYKLDALKDLLKTISGNAIICYVFKEDIKLLLENIPGSKLYTGEKEKVAWNKGEIKYLILSPFSEKYGLNLQESGDAIIWFGLIWSGESYVQLNGRLIRRGRKKDVDVYYILAKNSFDKYVYDQLIAKVETREDAFEKEFTRLLSKNV